MAIDKVGSVGGAGATPALETGKQQFGKVLEGVKGGGRVAGIPVSTEGPARPAPSEAVPGKQQAQGVERASAGRMEVKPGTRVDSVQSAREQQAAQMLDRVGQAQKRLDHILALAESGRTFTPAELLAFQAHVYAASQELDLAGKVVEKATGGIKQVLQTQV
ncbi:ATP-dependent helicase HrpB [Hyalangium gracile]|uniref:ATP-dependent helicase HrpB n=1 Tax=Hyalangium gracile TaxID=394092 RepID=UPI001CCB9A62|nr:ATP-dependent helicase HrpB [Hyalangium gracile]